MDEFLEEFYEEWMDTVIEQIPLTNRAPPHNPQFLHTPEQLYAEETTSDDIQEYGTQEYSTQEYGTQEYSTQEYGTQESQYNHRNYQENEYYQHHLRYPNWVQENNGGSVVYDSLVNNLYRLRRTLQIQNEITRQSNSIFDELISLVTDGLTENIPNEIELEDVKVILTPEQFEKLKQYTLTDETIEQYNNNPCNICMENYQVSEQITQLDCSHVFHKTCISHWLCNEHVTCPVCRKDTREGVSLK
jgi:hypothetical protein